jgi:predicted RNase H-like nuclease (RuvC/YqgF family)
MIETKLTLIVVITGLLMAAFCVMVIAKTCQAYRRELIKQLSAQNNMLRGDVEQYRRQVSLLKGNMNQLKSEFADSLESANRRIAALECELNDVSTELAATMPKAA